MITHTIISLLDHLDAHLVGQGNIGHLMSQDFSG